MRVTEKAPAKPSAAKSAKPNASSKLAAQGQRLPAPSSSPPRSGDPHGPDAISRRQTIMRKAFGPNSGASSPGSTEAQTASDPSPAGLSSALQTNMERMSGLSLADVRVHYNSEKPGRLQARAYTQGSNIFVGPSEERHVPHEAWHVVQQKQGRVQQTVQAKGLAINDDPHLEHEADVMGERARQMASCLPGSDAGASSPGRARPAKSPQIQYKKDIIQAKLKIGTEEISEDRAFEIDNAREEKDEPDSGAISFQVQKVSFLFRSFTEMMNYRHAPEKTKNIGLFRNNTWVILDPNTRYLIGEAHDNSPKDDLKNMVRPSNLIYEGQDHIGVDKDKKKLVGNEAQKNPHGGIDHQQLQQLYLTAAIVESLLKRGKAEKYQTEQWGSYVNEYTSFSALNLDIYELMKFDKMQELQQRGILNAIMQDFARIAGIATDDLAGRKDPISDHSHTLLQSMATNILDIQGLEEPSQLAGQKENLFAMRDYVMGGRIMSNPPPLIALMGQSHVKGAGNVVSGKKIVSDWDTDFIKAFASEGPARIAAETALGPANDIPKIEEKKKTKRSKKASKNKDNQKNDNSQNNDDLFQ